MTATRTFLRLATKNASQDDSWRDHGPCLQEDPDLFFPVGTGPDAKKQTREAKAVCGTCPVTAQCLQWALDTQQDTGVWGGLSEKERRRFHHRRSTGNRPSGVSAVDHILRNQLDEYLALEAQELEPLEVARELGTNVQTVYRLRDRIARQQAENGVEVKAA